MTFELKGSLFLDMCSVESQIIVLVNTVSEIGSCDAYNISNYLQARSWLIGANLNPGEQFSESCGPRGSRGWEPDQNQKEPEVFSVFCLFSPLF